jgi:hypothetical protein
VSEYFQSFNSYKSVSFEANCFANEMYSNKTLDVPGLNQVGCSCLKRFLVDIQRRQLSTIIQDYKATAKKKHLKHHAESSVTFFKIHSIVK